MVNMSLQSFNEQLRETLFLLEEQNRILASGTNETSSGLTESDKIELMRY